MTQDYPSFEVIVIDQAEESRLKEKFESLYPGDKRLKYIKELWAGAAKSRNVGIAAATGTVCAFIDDDALAGKGWLRGLSIAFSQNPQPALVAGRLLPLWEAQKPDWYPPDLEVYLGLYDLGMERRRLPDGHLPIGANMAGLRDVILEQGGFEESLGFNHQMNKHRMVACEETMLGRRILAAGHFAMYEPLAVVQHRISAYKLRRKYFLKRHFWEGVGLIEQMHLMGQISEESKAGIYRHHRREALMAFARAVVPSYNNDYPQSTTPVIRMTALHRLATSLGIMYRVYTLKSPNTTATAKCESV
jgi:glycosyltransferase involved in cell wall biosynthesis